MVALVFGNPVQLGVYEAYTRPLLSAKGQTNSTHNDTLQLYCMELFDYMCSGHDDQLLVQIYNITHCPIYWLQLAMYQCDHLLKVVHSKADKVS